MQRKHFLVVSLTALSLFASLVVAFGQAVPTRTVPTEPYFRISLPYLYDGQFGQAMASLDRDLRDAVKVQNFSGQQVLWLDSFCYWTMIGEAQFQRGRYGDALDAYNNALQIYILNIDWLRNVNYTGAAVSVPRVPSPWGTSTRKGGVGNFEKNGFRLIQQQFHIAPLADQGAVAIQQTQESVIHAGEIISCAALMIRRRAQILGPLSKYDPATKEISDILGTRPCRPNHWSMSWIDVLYGLSLAAMGEDEKAILELEKGLLMLGEFDHHLTPFALLELGEIALRAGKGDVAREAFFEASLSAALVRNQYFVGNPILLEEAFRRMSDAQKVVDRTKPCPPCALALSYFRNERSSSPLIMVTLLQEVAEDSWGIGDMKMAGDCLTSATGIMKSRALPDTRYGARNSYLSAMISYALAYQDYVSGKPLGPKLSDGDKHLGAALGFMRRGSLWLYHLATLETYYQKGVIAERSLITVHKAEELYELLLRDPTVADWATQPMDSLAVMTFTPPFVYQRWFFLAYQRGDKEKAFEVTERARRARFYASFALGPRLFSLRMLFEGGADELNQEQILEKQSLKLDFARFNEVSANVAKIKQELLTLPVAPTDPTQIERQKNLFRDLERMSQAEEALLRPIALSRTKAPNIFPPILTVTQIRNALPEKTTVLVFAKVFEDMYGFLIDKRNFKMWQVDNNPRSADLNKLITDYLSELGNRGSDTAVTVKELTDPEGKWRRTGNQLLKRLLGEEQSANFTELVVVPSDRLWYTPFESMCVGNANDLRPLLTAGNTPITIRYAPMASLAVPTRAGRSITSETLVVHGKLFRGQDWSVALNAVDRYLKAGVPNLSLMPVSTSDPRYREMPSSAGAFATRVKQLVVLDDISFPSNSGPLDWSPFTNDRGRVGHSISSWLTLPWGGPQLLVLPGFHTPAETALKTPRRSSSTTEMILPGDDLFLSAMVLQASGAKTILLTRWRVGGRTSYDLIGEFLLNHANNPATEAWRQAVMSVGGNTITLDEEPRVKAASGETPPIATHPFFWGAFLLIDRGESPPSAPHGTESKLDE